MYSIAVLLLIVGPAVVQCISQPQLLSSSSSIVSIDSILIGTAALIGDSHSQVASIWQYTYVYSQQGAALYLRQAKPMALFTAGTCTSMHIAPAKQPQAQCRVTLFERASLMIKYCSEQFLLIFLSQSCAMPLNAGCTDSMRLQHLQQAKQEQLQFVSSPVQQAPEAVRLKVMQQEQLQNFSVTAAAVSSAAGCTSAASRAAGRGCTAAN
jgi:hypothetical protein